jgi:nicotinamidase-related amidase
MAEADWIETMDPNQTALVVVDMQYFDAHRDWGEGKTAKDLGVESYFDPYFAQIDTITPVIADLIGTFRRKQMEVIHLRVAELTPDSRDVGYKQLVRGLIVPSTSKEAEFLPTLEPTPEEVVINKSSSGVFAATNFDRILRNLGVRTLVFTGTSTGGCVQSAIYDATDLGYEVVVVGDACADSTPESHIQSLASLERQATRIINAAEMQKRLADLPDGDVSKRSGVERVEKYLLRKPYASNSAGGAQDPYGAIFGPAIQVKLDRARSALILIDAQRLTCDPAQRPDALMADAADFEGYYERCDAALAKMADLLAGARAAGLPVIHVRTASLISGGRALSAKRRALGIDVSTASEAAQFMPQVAPRSDEAVLNKPGSSVFNGTGLDTLLMNMGIESVIMAGSSLDGAIESSLRSAGDRGYGSVLVTEACVAAKSVEARLAKYDKGIINIRTVEETLASLR